jgi:S-formylglutathione hydrolase FrmB
MPQVHRSCYADEVQGSRFWTFLSEELPSIAASFFRFSQRREDTFVAGLSMGGYGAFKWALRQPERFAAAASLSGALDLAKRQRLGGERAQAMSRVFGDESISGTENDLFWLLDQSTRTAANLPALFLCCGTEDHLFPENLMFRDAAERLGRPLTVEFGPGEHEWGYWDRMIQDVLRWLPLASR